MRNFFVSVCLTFALCSHAEAYTLLQVFDGDTVKLRDSQGDFKLRLTDIDAPERNQAFGKKSRRALMALCQGNNTHVAAHIVGMDKYQRYLGTLYCNQVDVNLYLVENGFAWYYRQYSNDMTIYNAQMQARQQKRGLWSAPNPIPPWVWRHKTADFP